MSVVQVRLLGILRDCEPGIRELARHLELKKSSLSGLVDRAERRRLLERLPSPNDRRAATIRVTARGRKLSRVVDEAVPAEVARLVQVLPVTDRRRLAAPTCRVLPESETNAVKR
jgi:DNA-binding MarR family transcriptional regulator